MTPTMPFWLMSFNFRRHSNPVTATFSSAKEIISFTSQPAEIWHVFKRSLPLFYGSSHLKLINILNVKVQPCDFIDSEAGLGRHGHPSFKSPSNEHYLHVNTQLFACTTSQKQKCSSQWWTCSTAGLAEGKMTSTRLWCWIMCDSTQWARCVDQNLQGNMHFLSIYSSDFGFSPHIQIFLLKENIKMKYIKANKNKQSKQVLQGK